MKSKIFAIATLLSLTTLVSAGPYDNWSAYKEVTVNTTTAAVAGTVANFPLLVRLTNVSAATGSDVLAASATGADIRFADATGNTALSYQIERWTSSAAEIWVMVPSVAGSANTVLRMYWGNGSATSESNGAAVFTTANGFVGAWHLGDAAGIDARPNSVAGAPAATPSNDFAPSSFGGGSAAYVIPTGMIGRGDSVRGGGTTGTRNAPTATCDFLNIGNAADAAASPYTGTNTFTGYSDFSTGYSFSLWFKPNEASLASWQYLSELATDQGASNNIQVFRPNGASTLRYENTNGATSGGIRTSTTGAFVAGTWSHFVVTVAAAATPTVNIYKNGVSVYAAAAATTQPLTVIQRTNAWLGKSNYGGDGYIAGVYDQPEISNVSRSADWVKLSYQTQVSTQTCVTFGSTVNAPPKTLSYSPNPAVFTVNFAIPSLNPTVVGAVTGYAVTPALPTGLTLNPTTGAITGTPTVVTAITSYLITASNGAGSDTETVRITVNSGLVAPTNLSYSTPVTYATNVAITPNVPTVTGTVQVYAVNPALPAGLSLNTTSGVISGTPTVATTAVQCTVTAGNGAGSTTAIVTITVIAPPSGLSYATPNGNYPANNIYVNNQPTVTGSVTGYTVTPALPAGLTLTPTTGFITGTPTTVQASTTYTVSANNSAGSATTTLTITVFGPPTNLFYSANPVSYNATAAIVPNTPTVTGTVTGYTVNPPLPAGLVLNATTGIISGTPTTPTGSYVVDTIFARNAAGATTSILNILILPPSAIQGFGAANPLELHIAGMSPLAFQMPAGANPVKVSIVDLWGRAVWSSQVTTGNLKLSWNGMAGNGRPASAGMYVVRVKVASANAGSVGVVERKITYSP